MKISEVPTPEVYRDSYDFRFFLRWFETCLTKIQTDTDNLLDLYDPQRCPSDLLWMLADTEGYRLDDRMCIAYNRLVLLYFMSMIRNKGSKNGMTLAAELNLAQFNINKYGEDNSILYDRLEDTSIPVNSAYVSPNKEAGYIDVVYFSEEKPVDVCIEYVRPAGMYCFQHAGVAVQPRTKISVDARLTHSDDSGVSLGSSHVNKYTRSDYSSLQRNTSVTKKVATKTKVIRTDKDGNIMKDENGNTLYAYINLESKEYRDNQILDNTHSRNPAYYRNVDYEDHPSKFFNPGYRALFSLQLSNNEHIVKSLLPNVAIFDIGYGPQPETVEASEPADYILPKYRSEYSSKPYNLLYNAGQDSKISDETTLLKSGVAQSVVAPMPAVNQIMSTVGDALKPLISESDSKEE